MYNEQIINYMKKMKKPVFIDEIAKELKVSWQTAKTALLELAALEKIKVKKHGGSWVFWIEVNNKK